MYGLIHMVAQKEHNLECSMKNESHIVQCLWQCSRSTYSAVLLTVKSYTIVIFRDQLYAK